MLTDYELDELHESYEMPFESGSTIDCLEDEYETVYRCGVDDNSELLRHAYTVESMIAVVESLIRERDHELYESILADSFLRETGNLVPVLGHTLTWSWELSRLSADSIKQTTSQHPIVRRVI